MFRSRREREFPAVQPKADLRDGRRLEVSAGRAPGIADDTQLNLVLLSSPAPGSQLNTAP